jgi:hypothetical protein
MRDRPAERRRFRGEGIDMDELQVFRDLGEGVDARLADFEPARDPGLCPDLGLQLRDRDRGPRGIEKTHGVVSSDDRLSVGDDWQLLPPSRA